jgi:hypothetical protein
MQLYAPIAARRGRDIGVREIPGGQARPERLRDVVSQMAKNLRPGKVLSTGAKQPAKTTVAPYSAGETATDRVTR